MPRGDRNLMAGYPCCCSGGSGSGLCTPREFSYTECDGEDWSQLALCIQEGNVIVWVDWIFADYTHDKDGIDYRCNWSALNCTELLYPVRSMTPADWRVKYEATDCPAFYYTTDCEGAFAGSETNFLSGVVLDCTVEGDLEVSAGMFCMTTDCNAVVGDWIWYADAVFSFPITFPRTFTLTGVAPSENYLFCSAFEINVFAPYLVQAVVHVELPCNIREDCGILGPIASFTAERSGPSETSCAYTLNSTSTDGRCGTGNLRYFWSTGHTGPGPHYVNIGDSEPCGEIERDITLTVIDTVSGCWSQSTQTLGCGCCCGGSGSLTVMELEPCRFELCAAVTSEEECGIGFIEWQLMEPGTGCPMYWSGMDCNECVEPGEPIELCGCYMGSLTDAQCTEFTIARTSRLRWRYWPKACGCPGPWVYEDDLICANCDCCDGLVGGAIVTVIGVDDCPNRNPEVDCNCSAANTAYDVPASETCIGDLTFEDVVTCTADEVSGTSSVRITWEISCDEFGYWLTLGFYTAGTAGIFGLSNTVFLGADKPDCEDISACVEIDSGLVADACYCDWYTLLTLCAEFYPASGT